MKVELEVSFSCGQTRVDLDLKLIRVFFKTSVTLRELVHGNKKLRTKVLNTLKKAALAAAKEAHLKSVSFYTSDIPESKYMLKEIEYRYNENRVEFIITYK